ncbi:hypothetical protein AN958_12643 [Leucoagaricus sp. SymC.cos]|nr:hypothetical protein AN958_12643 [Leucoagaricus sp. SymC.cos]
MSVQPRCLTTRVDDTTIISSVQAYVSAWPPRHTRLLLQFGSSSLHLYLTARKRVTPNSSFGSIAEPRIVDYPSTRHHHPSTNAFYY